jgi:hypothetical protein
MESGRFKVFDHLHDWLSEFRLFHRLEGKIVPEFDDLLSATRYAAPIEYPRGGHRMINVHKVIVQVRPPRATFPGEVAEGFYCVVDSSVVLTDAGGKPIGSEKRHLNPLLLVDWYARVVAAVQHRLSVAVAHHETGVSCFDCPGRREATRERTAESLTRANGRPFSLMAAQCKRSSVIAKRSYAAVARTIADLLKLTACGFV